MKKQDAINFLRESVGIPVEEYKFPIPPQTDNMTYDQAVKKLEMGVNMARAGWGKDQYVFPKNENGALKLTKRDEKGDCGGYKATKKDKEASDWKVYEKPVLSEEELRAWMEINGSI